MTSTGILVHQSSSSTGTGNLTLASLSGKQDFSDAFGTGTTTDVFYYYISHQSAKEWEYGTGHMSDSTTLVRDTVISSSNSDAAVNFSAGVKDVSNDMPPVSVSTDGTLASNSDSLLPTQKAVKTYADALIAANDAMVFKGVQDCSANPNYPAADSGHTYKVSVAGKIGGASGDNVEVGDLLICTVDGTAAGTKASVGANWAIIQANIDNPLKESDIGTTVQAYDADTLKADTTDTLTTGFATTSYNAGTKSSGTYTPDEANGNFQYATNGGAHTLAPPTNDTNIVIQYTNGASAGTVTTSGFTFVTGDTITTTDGDDFLFFITKINGFSHLNVVALQ